MATITAQRKRKNFEPQLQRVPFKISRELDFLSEGELVAQTGHPPRDWPLVLLKELLDNALDACEEQRIAPEIKVVVGDHGITATDNGPGIPPEVVQSVLDFSMRVSSRAAYVAPDRGKQGNALKTIVAMPFVLSGETGVLSIDAQGFRHEITLKIDRVRQKPLVEHQLRVIEQAPGTSIFVSWPDSPRSIEPSTNSHFLQNGAAATDSPWSDDSDDEDDFLQNEPPTPDSPWSMLLRAKERFLQFAHDYTWLNPHLSLSVEWLHEKHHWPASNPAWAKWRPSDPTDPHWYRLEDLERLLAAHIARDEDSGAGRTVREFITDFRGLSGSQKGKRVLDAAGLARAKLVDLAGDEGVDRQKVAALLAAMQQETRPVKANALGLLGEDHLRSCCEAAGGEMKSFHYKREMGVQAGAPWVLETAFAWAPEATGRRIITGVNWSPGILNPFRQLGAGGRSLDEVLAEQRVQPDEPTILVLHLICPRVVFADRGKSSVVIEE